MSFHKLPQIILSMDNKFNIDVVELKKQGINIANIKEFEKLVKNLYLKIDLNYIYEKYKNFYTSKLNEITNFLKGVKVNYVYDFYGYEIGNLNKFYYWKFWN